MFQTTNQIFFKSFKSQQPDTQVSHILPRLCAACHALGPGRKKCKSCFKLQETTNRYTQLVQDVAENNWLVVSTPLKNISSWGYYSQYMEKNLPNHQPHNYIDNSECFQRFTLFLPAAILMFAMPLIQRASCEWQLGSKWCDATEP